MVMLSLNSGQTLNSDLALLYSHLSFLTIEKLPIQEHKSSPWHGICVFSLPWDSARGHLFCQAYQDRLAILCTLLL